MNEVGGIGDVGMEVSGALPQFLGQFGEQLRFDAHEADVGSQAVQASRSVCAYPA